MKAYRSADASIASATIVFTVLSFNLLGDGVREVLKEQDNAFVIGEDVAGAGSVYGYYKGLLDEFGAERAVAPQPLRPIVRSAVPSVGRGAPQPGPDEVRRAQPHRGSGRQGRRLLPGLQRPPPIVGHVVPPSSNGRGSSPSQMSGRSPKRCRLWGQKPSLRLRHR